MTASRWACLPPAARCQAGRRKAARFVSFDSFGISLLTLVNSTALRSPPNLRRRAACRRGRPALAYANAATAMITLITGSAAGSAYVACAQDLGRTSPLPGRARHQRSRPKRRCDVRRRAAPRLKTDSRPRGARRRICRKAAYALRAQARYIDEIINPPRQDRL